MPSSSEPVSPKNPWIGHRPRTTALGAYLEGWRRTLAAPHLTVGVLLMTMLTSYPLAWMVSESLERRFGATQGAEGAIAEFIMAPVDDSTFTGGTLTVTILGFGALLDSVSGLVDGEGVPTGLVATVAWYLLLSVFLSGGLIDRLARARPIGADVFMATCGRYFLRLVRFAIIAGLGYWAIFRWVYPAIFSVAVPWLVRDSVAEGRMVGWQMAGYAVFLSVLGFFALVTDVSRVRLVVEDRLSAIAAWSAGWRFVRRRAGRLVWLFVLNMVGQLALARIWMQVAPAMDRADWVVLGSTAVFLLVRVWTRLAFIASEVVFFQGELAHATYAAAPVPAWPESASVEAVRNLGRGGEERHEHRLR